jgi:hypothetical protein
MDQQQNHLISLIAVFLALGIGILIGASMGENALVLHQIAFIEELKSEILRYKEEINTQFLSFSQLQEELLLWEALEEEYLNPLLLENKLKNVEIKVIALEDLEEGLEDFLQISGCSYLTFVFTETSSWQDPFFLEKLAGDLKLPAEGDKEIFIVSGYPDPFFQDIIESLKQQGKVIIQVADGDNTLNVTATSASFPVVNNIDKFYNKIKLLELIQELAQGGNG